MGTDNRKQMLSCFGAAKLAETYRECFVMAPQSSTGGVGKTPVGSLRFADSYDGQPNGWTREYLSRVCDLIRGMIARGNVDPGRVYVTGFGMGGAGTLKALSVGADLFAAGLPICPTMTPETYNILCGLTHTKLWVTCSYLDHTYYRHNIL